MNNKSLRKMFLLLWAMLVFFLVTLALVYLGMNIALSVAFGFVVCTLIEIGNLIANPELYDIYNKNRQKTNRKQ